MAAFTTIAAAVGLGLQVVGMMGQQDAADDQASAMRDQAEAQKASERAKARMAETQAQRERISQVREARVRRAQILASAGSQGIGAGTSSVSGAVGSIGTQTGSNIGTINQTETFAGQASQANQAAADASSRAATAGAEYQQWGAFSNFGSQMMTGAGGWTTIFGGNTFKGK